MSSRNCTAINAWLWTALLLFGVTAQAAQVAGTVADLNGPLLAKKADGTMKILSQKSSVEAGDQRAHVAVKVLYQAASAGTGARVDTQGSRSQ